MKTWETPVISLVSRPHWKTEEARLSAKGYGVIIRIDVLRGKKRKHASGQDCLVLGPPYSLATVGRHSPLFVSVFSPQLTPSYKCPYRPT